MGLLAGPWHSLCFYKLISPRSWKPQIEKRNKNKRTNKKQVQNNNNDEKKKEKEKKKQTLFFIFAFCKL